MRISSDVNIPQPVDASQTTQASSQSSPGTANAGLASDTSKLTSGGANVLTLVASVNQFPEIRQEKVANLAQQVRSGSYSPQAGQSAEALMSSMLLPSAA
jgi:anti-sigma28 factor (negative regulator of flagellin synthesis)